MEKEETNNSVAVAPEEAKEAEEKVQEEVRVERPKPKSQDHNWAQARAVMSSQAQEIQQLKNTLVEIQRREDSEDEKFDPEDLANYANVSKIAKKTVSKETRQLQEKIEKLEKSLYEKEQQALEDKARSRFDDYDYIIENFAVPMIQKDASLANAIKASLDPYAMAYKLAKSSDEYEDFMKQNVQPTKKAEKVMKNNQRPLSASAATGSMQSQSDYFSNLSSKEIWEMSQKYARKA